MKFRTDVSEDFPGNVLELEELVDVYLLEGFIENEPKMTKIDVRWKDADTFKMLDWCRRFIVNPYRISTLAKALLEEELDSSRIVAVIKDTMIGHGLKFLPQNLSDLQKHLQIQNLSSVGPLLQFD